MKFGFFYTIFKKTKIFYILDKIYQSNLKMKQFTIEEINDVLKGTIVGSITTKITAPEQLEVAKETEDEGERENP